MNPSEYEIYKQKNRAAMAGSKIAPASTSSAFWEFRSGLPRPKWLIFHRGPVPGGPDRPGSQGPDKVINPR